MEMPPAWGQQKVQRLNFCEISAQTTLHFKVEKDHTHDPGCCPRYSRKKNLRGITPDPADPGCRSSANPKGSRKNNYRIARDLFTRVRVSENHWNL